MTAKTKTEPKTEIKDESKSLGRRCLETKPNEIQSGDLMAITYWVKVKDNRLGRPYKDEHQLLVDDLDGGPEGITVTGNGLIERCGSADRYQETIKMSQTKILELFVTSHGRPFTVNYDKQANKKTGIVENRTLRGRYIGQEDLRGRSWVEDLDNPIKDRFRQVDHRTLKWLIVDGIRYEAD